jgi:hypothetical protein
MAGCCQSGVEGVHSGVVAKTCSSGRNARHVVAVWVRFGLPAVNQKSAISGLGQRKGHGSFFGVRSPKYDFRHIVQFFLHQPPIRQVPIQRLVKLPAVVVVKQAATPLNSSKISHMIS